MGKIKWKEGPCSCFKVLGIHVPDIKIFVISNSAIYTVTVFGPNVSDRLFNGLHFTLTHFGSKNFLQTRSTPRK